MSIAEPLFAGKLICLAPINPEQDAEIESRWTHDPVYLRMLDSSPVYPLSSAQIRKKYETIDKQSSEGNTLFYFTIRALSDDRLIGFTRLYWVDWTNSNAFIELGIGNPADRRNGYGGEALGLMIRYTFHELNLYRLTAMVPEYNSIVLHLLTKSGFSEEVRRRCVLNRDGRLWDLLNLGLLRDEWVKNQGGLQ
jgi:RimJ/RimL family protein N-acetyltransferase